MASIAQFANRRLHGLFGYD